MQPLCLYKIYALVNICCLKLHKVHFACMHTRLLSSIKATPVSVLL
jgi:hypothetical protein